MRHKPFKLAIILFAMIQFIGASVQASCLCQESLEQTDHSVMSSDHMDMKAMAQDKYGDDCGTHFCAQDVQLQSMTLVASSFEEKQVLLAQDIYSNLQSFKSLALVYIERSRDPPPVPQTLIDLSVLLLI
ncbi:MAG: hypothetical protein ACKVIX_06625 [Sphingomonadales bacterium]